jgi:O-antigen/teichoic acid export membrane protein
MTDDTTARQDHPYLAHYGWSADGEDDDRFRITPEQEARNAQHAADKAAVEGGRTLRLVLAAPIIIWSFAGLPVLALFVLLVLLGAVEESLVDWEGPSSGLLLFIALLVLIEVASVWEGLLLMRDELNARKWRIVVSLATVAAVIVTAAMAAWAGAVTQGVVIVLALVWYAALIAAWQWRRSVRLASAVERLDTYSP